MKKFSWVKILGVCFTVSLVVGMIGGALTNEYLISYLFGQLIQKQEEELPIVKKVIEEHTYIEETLVLDAIQKVAPSVVGLFESETDALLVINDELDPATRFLSSTSDNFYLDNSPVLVEKGINGGSGFILTTDGIVATCSSLVQDQTTWNIVTSDDALYSADVVYKDPYDDIALLKINNKEEFEFFNAIPFTQNDLLIGQNILAVGEDLFGALKVKSGIISNVVPEKEEDLLKKRIFPGQFHSVDFEINENLQCGPLVNMGGELIGIMTDFESVESGTSYIIPHQSLSRALEQLPQ